MEPQGKLYFGDNLDLLRNLIPDNSVQLIYMDPPFNSQQDYFVPVSRAALLKNSADTKAFGDRWKWTDEVEQRFQRFLEESPVRLNGTMTGFRMMLGECAMLAYLLMIAERLIELWRILADDGSIYLHCDPKAGSHLKLLMDAVFGAGNYQNHIVWCYGLGGSTIKRWPRKHDDIFWYSKSENYYFEPVMIPATSVRMKGEMKKAPDYWTIPAINNMANERTGYPTQKPEALLERIVMSSSNTGSVVLDPFCGSGTTLAVAQRHGRKWIGIDNSTAAIEIAQNRLTITAINA